MSNVYAGAYKFKSVLFCFMYSNEQAFVMSTLSDKKLNYKTVADIIILLP